MPSPQRTDPENIRREYGFLSVAEVLQLCETQTIFDPSSTLISRRARLGGGNIFYPGAVVQVDEQSSCVIGQGNTFYPGTFLLAARGGMILLGSGISLGPGGVQLQADSATSAIAVGDRVRLRNGPEVSGRSVLGTGSQILGAIQAESVVLADGEDFNHADPDKRGAVLNGTGLARGLRLDAGDQISAWGDFAAAPRGRQKTLAA